MNLKEKTKMLLCYLLLSIIFSSSAEGDPTDNPPAVMTMGATKYPVQTDNNPVGGDSVEAPPPCQCSSPQLIRDQQQEVLWRREVLDLLTQLVQVQRETAAGQAELVKLLGMLGTQGSQQILDLHNVARYQSLLVENLQALLLQTSRIATQLQEVPKKPTTLSQ
ncbi:uncharacterized protein ACBR49_010241 [Aulostomus maculatus]